MPYLAYTLPPAARDLLLRTFPLAIEDGWEARCDHVTVTMNPRKPPPGLALGDCRDIVVVGRHADDMNDVLVVEVGGALDRADGRLNHITLGLRPALGARSARSNDLLLAVRDAEGEAALRNLHAPVPLGPASLELHPLLHETAPREQEPASGNAVPGP